MWLCVGLIVPIVWRDNNIFVFRDKLSDPAHPRNWRQFSPLKWQELHTQWHNVTSQKTWVYSNSIVRTWNVRLLGCTSTCHLFSVFNLAVVDSLSDRLCGLVVRVSGYRYRGLRFNSRRYHIFWVVVGLEQGPLSLVRSIEELLE